MDRKLVAMMAVDLVGALAARRVGNWVVWLVEQ